MNRLDALAGKNILLTGATGLIGGEILHRLLQLGPAGPSKIFCLVRSAAPRLARAKLTHRLRLTEAGRTADERMVAVPGDISKPGLAVSPRFAVLLREQTDIVIHCAAVTSFLKPRACQAVNVNGLRMLLEFAATFARPPQFVYLGSAASCGDRRDVCLVEGEYPRPGDGHFVRYTETKAVAELLLRRQTFLKDWLVVRPSIVLADNVTDEDLARGMIWALVLMKEIRHLPINGKARIDAVPLTYVGDCALRLIAKSDRQHNCYHISAGEQRAVTWHEVLDVLRETYEAEIQCYDPAEWDPARVPLSSRERRLLRAISWYLPFINQNVVFSSRRLCQELNGDSPKFRHYSTYLPDLLQSISLDKALLESRDP